MFLSKRERPPDTSAAPNKSSPVAYQRTRIPPISILSVAAAAPPTSSSAQRRAPLAPLDPQLAFSTLLDDHMSSASSSSTSASRLDRPQRLDTARDAETARANIGRQIIARPIEDDHDPGLLSLRKRSVSSHNNSARSLPYPPRSAQRRSSNTPSVTSSSSRRPSIPSISVPSQNLPPSISSLQPAPSHPDQSLYINDDLYSGLSTFTFGAANPASSQALDTSDTISPLTRVPGSGSADRTPRPSISGASGGRRKSYSNRVSDPAEGDDEYEDEDDDARGKVRSKMRAIDDGTRRPSLPTNSLSAISTSTTPPPPSSSSNTDNETSPTDRSVRSHDSEVESSEPEGEDAEAAEFDTDVELDMTHHHGNSSLDPPLSDTASQRTFGAGGFDHYGYWRHPADPQSREADDDDEEEIESISPVTFRHDEEEEGYDDGDRPLPSLVLSGSRRGSLPWETLSPRGLPAGREREDSTMTIVSPRASKSVDDLTAPATPAESQQPTRRDSRASDGQAAFSGAESGLQVDDEFQYGPYDLNYILSGVDSRKSWSSGASSYVQPGARRPSGDPATLAAAWDTELFKYGRRPSTVTVNSSEDAFTRHIRDWDPDYNVREERWSFKKESSDGRGPHRMQLTTSTTQGSIAPMTHTMMPQTQEMWRQEFVGRYKVDRLRIPSEAQARDKGPQQRLHVRHIPDPFLKSSNNIRAGPHAVIHKHSKVVAFSIFRHNSVLPPHSRKDARTPFDRSGGILLANKRVQEAYTSTHTTSRLNSHGLLAGADARAYDGPMILPSNASTRSRSSTPGVNDANYPRLGPSSMDMMRDSVSPPPPPPKDSLDGATTSTSLTAAALDTASNSDASVGRSSSIKTRSSTLFSQRSHSRSPSRRESETEDSDSPPRTSHAEAFATVDASYYELMRARAAQRHTEEPQHSSRLSAFRKLFGPQRNASSHSSGSSSASREGNYIPPWVVLAPRSKQEESQRVIQNLNESFQDVGLLPTNSKSASRGKNQKGKGRQERRDRQASSILEKVPKDSLYMLLPLWPGETDPASAKAGDDSNMQPIPVEDRQYLLVYYVPFEDKEKKKADQNKKRSRGVKDSPSNPSGSIVDLPLFLLRSFRVNARLVAYDDLRYTGVRVPPYGLTVTGSMAEANQYLPSPSIREQRLDEVVICHCTSRGSGMKFDPDGLSKLGLCMPTDTPAAMQIPDSVIPEPEEAVLTPIGRAAVEMAWLGCMAVTSFGTV